MKYISFMWILFDTPWPRYQIQVRNLNGTWSYFRFIQIISKEKKNIWNASKTLMPIKEGCNYRVNTSNVYSSNPLRFFFCILYQPIDDGCLLQLANFYSLFDRTFLLERFFLFIVIGFSSEWFRDAFPGWSFLLFFPFFSYGYLGW